MKTVLSRRKMLQDSTKVALGGTILLNSPFSILHSGQEKKTRVVIVRNKLLLDDSGKLNPQVLAEMLDDAVLNLTNARSADEAWKKIISKDDVVGIKSNHWNYLPTPPELERLLKDRITGAGVGAGDISINDRGVLSDPVFRRATALINTRPMRTHAWSGVGSMLKNYIMFTPNPSSYHGDSCADLAKLWSLPEVKGKTKLNILVMITPLFHGVGSHHFSKEYIWPYKGLIVGFDPVAVDLTGVQILLAKRREYFQEERPLNPPAKHIVLADTRHHLGTADLSKIELVKLGWMNGILI
jgi:hypothetical protein